MKVKVKNLDYELREKKAKAKLAILTAKLEALKSELQWPYEPEEEIKIGKPQERFCGDRGGDTPPTDYRYPCVYYEQENGVCKKFTEDNFLSYCVEGPCPYERSSRADKIRSMTDSELADFLCEHMSCNCCPVSKYEDLYGEAYCPDQIGKETKLLTQWLCEPEE